MKPIRLTSLLSGLSLVLLAGCSGTSKQNPDLTSGATNGTQQTFGSLTTRAVGTTQAPVAAAGSGAVITGVAGATFTDIAETDNDPPTIKNTRIIFNSNKSGKNQIWSMNADGSDIKQLTFDTSGESDGARLSPDGTKIAFHSNRNGFGGLYHIYIMNVDGTGVTPISNATNFSFLIQKNEYSPEWSPDGTKLLYMYEDSTSDYDIAGYDLNSNNNILIDGKNTNDQRPTYSPDGKLILFQRQVGTVNRIFTMPATGGTATQVDTGTGTFTDIHPRFSPDGTKIAFASNRISGAAEDIYTVPANGGTPTLIYSSPNGDKGPVWSSDGSRILFGSNNGFYNLLTIASDGTDPQALTTNSTFNSYPGGWGKVSTANTTIRKYIGTGGLLGTKASGFLFGQQGKKTTALLTFDINIDTTAARSDVRITPLTGLTPGIPNVVFSLGFNSTTNTSLFNSIKYLNNISDIVAPVAKTAVGTGGSMATAGAAIISFDAADGTVASVIPYNATRSQGSGIVKTTEGDVLVLRGHFPVILNGKGENIAESGASEVRIDTRTGKLLSTR